MLVEVKKNITMLERIEITLCPSTKVAIKVDPVVVPWRWRVYEKGDEEAKKKEKKVDYGKSRLV